MQATHTKGSKISDFDIILKTAPTSVVQKIKKGKWIKAQKKKLFKNCEIVFTENKFFITNQTILRDKINILKQILSKCCT